MLFKKICQSIVNFLSDSLYEITDQKKSTFFKSMTRYRVEEEDVRNAVEPSDGGACRANVHSSGGNSLEKIQLNYFRNAPPKIYARSSLISLVAHCMKSPTKMININFFKCQYFAIPKAPDPFKRQYSTIPANVLAWSSGGNSFE